MHTPSSNRRETSRTSARRGLAAGLSALVWLACLAGGAAAHEGPPFPVIVDEVHPPWSLSVWADPDVGIGTFYVQLEALDGASLPDDTVVHVSVAPADGRLPLQRWPARRGLTSYGEQHEAEVDFPTREFWNVEVELASASAGADALVGFGIEVTPPGYGPIDVALYMWPFVLLGVLWIVALRRRRQWMRAAEADGD